jgi:hypothetical protein
VTHFTIFCEIVEEEERVTPALLIPLKVLRFRVCWQATEPCMGSLTRNLLALFLPCQTQHSSGQQSVIRPVLGPEGGSLSHWK